MPTALNQHPATRDESEEMIALSGRRPFAPNRLQAQVNDLGSACTACLAISCDACRFNIDRQVGSSGAGDADDITGADLVDAGFSPAPELASACRATPNANLCNRCPVRSACKRYEDAAMSDIHGGHPQDPEYCAS